MSEETKKKTKIIAERPPIPQMAPAVNTPPRPFHTPVKSGSFRPFVNTRKH